MLIETIESRASASPDAPALIGRHGIVSNRQLIDEMYDIELPVSSQCIGILMDNSPAWAIIDLAMWMHNKTCVPLPHFFSDSQLLHTFTDAYVDILFTDQPERVEKITGDMPLQYINIAGYQVHLFQLKKSDHRAADDVAKITYTSGTTGAPKGVCLTKDSMEKVINSLMMVSMASANDSSLALMPLSTLLENIGGLYTPLLAGGYCHLPSLSELALFGNNDVNLAGVLELITHCRPSSVIFVPEMLHILTQAVSDGFHLPDSLRFIAVGGARVPTLLLERAIQLGIPVFEGYGLSEATSVVTLNSPQQNRPGSVGKPLPHVRIQITHDNEIMVNGAVFSGYLGGSTQLQDFIATGDMGYLDSDGFLYITGRKKNLFITSFGRNISPEWLESELLLQPEISQVLVFGESRPFNIAIIVPVVGTHTEALNNAIAMCNKTLPEYAHIVRYIVAEEPFSILNQQLTGSGRIRRKEIIEHYRNTIQDIYAEVA